MLQRPCIASQGFTVDGLRLISIEQAQRLDGLRLTVHSLGLEVHVGVACIMSKGLRFAVRSLRFTSSTVPETAWPTTWGTLVLHWAGSKMAEGKTTNQNSMFVGATGGPRVISSWQSAQLSPPPVTGYPLIPCRLCWPSVPQMTLRGSVPAQWWQHAAQTSLFDC